MARYLVHDRGHHRLAIDPAVTNERAIRAYQRVGFRPGGVMRQYERGHDGQWHDCLLMDLLASDLHWLVARGVVAGGTPPSGRLTHPPSLLPPGGVPPPR